MISRVEVLAKAFDGLHYCLFGFVVERAGGFVKNDDIGLLVKRPCDPNALTLAAIETDATFTNKGLVLLGPRFDAVGELRLLGGFFHSLMIDLLVRQRQCFLQWCCQPKKWLVAHGQYGLARRDYCSALRAWLSTSMTPLMGCKAP
jgi:hypothetical protein